MSRVISQIELGSSVWLREDDTDAEYILTRKDQNGCELLRKYCVSQRRMHLLNVSVYENCEADQWLTNSETGFLSRFSVALRSNLVNRSISTFAYGDSECYYISRRCYLYSYGDLFMTSSSALYPEINIVQALMVNKGSLDANTARIARNQANTENVIWWLRSASSAAGFWNVSSNGSTYSNIASNASIWMRPVLNVSPDTIVSDEGANIIYLLPEEKPRIIEFKGRVGESSTRPKKVLVRIRSSNLETITIKVCNNYEDSVPVWENVTLDQETSLENSSKQTDNWVIGIQCHGEVLGLSNGYFEEPIVIVEAE